MKAAFHKISIDFEYLNEIYTINSDPYNTLSELKDIVCKKIFPCPGNVHCIYKNVDLFDKEDEEIIKLFPHNSKIKIKLKKPQKERVIRKSILNYNIRPNLKTLENIPQKCYPSIEALISPEKKSKTLRKKKIIRLMSLPSMTNTVTNSRPSSKQNNKIVEEAVNDNIKNNDLFYFLHKNEIDKYKTSKKINNKVNSNELKKVLKSYQSSKNQNILTDIKDLKDIDFLLLNLKGKNLNKLKFRNNKSLNFTKNYILNDKEHKTEIKNSKTKIMDLNISSEEKEIKEDEVTDNNNEENTNTNFDNNKNNNNNTNPINKDIIDENYECSSCQKEIISVYCINCNQFKCNSCIQLCKADEHEYIQINLEDDCINNIISFGEMVNSNIDKNLEDISEFDKEIQVYDIVKYKNNLITFFNEILNIYNEIIDILRNIYKIKGRAKEMNKFETESNKIKTEINEILQKANSYLKSDANISKPKYKMMNMQYFFNLINEKEKAYDSINKNMKKYSLNTTINSNMEKCFNQIENLMKSLLNKENPFSLEGDLKNEYKKLIETQENSRRDKKRLYMKRKTLSVKPIHLPHFPLIGVDKQLDLDVNNSELLEI